MKNATIREAVAVFDDLGKLENAVSKLQSNGIDRSELSFLAHTSLADPGSDDSRRLANDPTTQRESAVTDTDIRQGRVLGTSLAGVAGLMAAGFAVATGGIAAAVLSAAAAAGGIGAAGALIGRNVADEASLLDAQLERGGVLLWVRTRDADADRRALEVLRRFAAHMRLHDLPGDSALQRAAGDRE